MPQARRPSTFPQPVAAAWDGLSGLPIIPETSSRRNRALILAAVAILAALSGLVGWLTWDLRRISLTEATEQHIRLADRAADVLARDIDVNALVIETIRVSLENPVAADLDEQALHALLFDGLRDVGAIGEIMVTDSAGNVVQSLKQHEQVHAAIGSRPYFKAHRDDPMLGLSIAGPLVNPYTKEPMVILSRRRPDRDGAFAGIILASVRVSYLQALLDRVNIRPNCVVTVMQTNGQVLVEAPSRAGRATDPSGKDASAMGASAMGASAVGASAMGASAVGASAMGAPAMDAGVVAATARMRSGSFTAVSQSDGRARLYAYRTLDNAALVVVASTALSDVLADWVRMTWVVAVGLIIADAAAVGLFLAIRGELRRRRGAEWRATMSERRLRLKIEAIEDHAFFATDRTGRVATWNQGAETLLGFDEAAALGRPIESMLAEPETMRTDPTPLAVSRAAGRWEMETECRRQDGGTFPAVVILSAILDRRDQPVGHSVIIHDLSRKQRMERRIRAMERMDAIGQVTSGVAHDFNNLLQAQIMSLELLRDCLDPAGGERELLDVSLNAAEQAAQLTDQLLAFSRQQMLRPSLVALGDLLVSLVALAQHTAGPNIRLCPIVARDLEPVSVDPSQLQTALLNLIINARDSITGSGAVTLHAYLADSDSSPPAGCDSETGFVVVAVTDTGRGMDQATAERACEPFFSTKGHGSGLGLSMVQGFARQSGGDIRITSVLNRGTRVEIWLPRLTDAPAVAESPAPGHQSMTGHILLVDDAPDVLLVLAAFLRGAGFAVTQAGNAREALWHLSRGTSFTLMVSDFIMPGMDGLDLAKQARRSRPDLPVLIISGFAQTDRLSDLPVGLTLLRKPFRKEELLDAVSRLLPEASELTPADGDSWTSPGPPEAGAVVEPSSWDASPQSAGPRPKPTSV